MAARKTPGKTLAEIRRLPAAVDVPLAAEAYGVSRATAYQSIADGTFPAQTIKVRGRIKVLTSSIIESLEGRADRAQSA